jgi:hypothetical protein
MAVANESPPTQQNHSPIATNHWERLVVIELTSALRHEIEGTEGNR